MCFVSMPVSAEVHACQDICTHVGRWPNGDGQLQGEFHIHTLDCTISRSSPINAMSVTTHPIVSPYSYACT